jgi:hypothetical protein
MRISFDVNVKAMLAVVALGGVAAGSFYGGERHQEHKSASPLAPVVLSVKVIETLDDLETSQKTETQFCWANHGRRYIDSGLRGECTAEGYTNTIPLAQADF